MKKLYGPLLIVIALTLFLILCGFTQSNNPTEYNKNITIPILTGTQYSFNFPSYYRGLQEIQLTFIGNCSSVSTFFSEKNSKEIINKSNNGTIQTNIWDSRGKEYQIIINSTAKNDIHETYLPINQSWVGPYTNNSRYDVVIINEKNSEEPTLISSHNITRIDTGCKILVFAKEHETIFNLHQHHQKLNYSSKYTNNITNQTLPFTPKIKLSYNIKGINKLRDDITYYRWGPTKINTIKVWTKSNKLTISIHVLLLTFLIVGCFHYNWEKMLKIILIILIPYFMLLEAISLLIEIQEIIILPTILILGSIYIITQRKEICTKLKKKENEKQVEQDE
jgi:hypothetical protein